MRSLVVGLVVALAITLSSAYSQHSKACAGIDTAAFSQQALDTLINAGYASQSNPDRVQRLMYPPTC